MTGRWRIRVAVNPLRDTKFIVQQYGTMVGYPVKSLHWAFMIINSQRARNMMHNQWIAVNPILDPREEPS